jgi:hypothetical protein
MLCTKFSVACSFDRLLSEAHDFSLPVGVFFFCEEMLCGIVAVYQRLEGTYSLHLQFCSLLYVKEIQAGIIPWSSGAWTATALTKLCSDTL